MNDMIDDKTLADYLKRDTEFSRRYRAIDANDVPPELDRTVIEIAESGVRTPSKLKTWRRWSAPLAMAATLVLAVSIVIRGNVDNRSPQPSPAATDTATSKEKSEAVMVDIEPTTAPEIAAPKIEQPAPLATLTAPASPAPQTKATEVEKPAAPSILSPLSVQATRQRETVQNSPIAISAISQEEADSLTASPQKGAADNSEARRTEPQAIARRTAIADTSQMPSLEEIAVTGQARTAANQSAGPRNTISTTQLKPREPSPERLAKELREADPDVWLRYIRELRKNGKALDADREWNSFVKTFPNHPVAVDDAARPAKAR